MMDKILQPPEWQSTQGETITVGDVRVTPEARSLTVRGPFGGMAWGRPVAVIVEQQGQTARVPIVDVTRNLQLLLWGLSLLFALLSLRRPARARSKHHER